MAKRKPKLQPTWTDVKAKLAGFDQKRLLGLVQDLYTAGKDNQAFLHARFGLGDDVLYPYKRTIDRWLSPDLNQDVSVVKATQAVSQYRKAAGDPAGLTELMVFYCERAAGFSSSLGYCEDSYLNSLVRMFGKALATANTLPASSRDAMIARLHRVAKISHSFGYGVADAMDSLLQGDILG